MEILEMLGEAGMQLQRAHRKVKQEKYNFKLANEKTSSAAEVYLRIGSSRSDSDCRAAKVL
ncbi:hypothetical protein [Paenibacillus sp. TC-CSREp1]|uniref:hypothetical protein n=1 Tax=Paenibacillus sp. TC-CSREp1 TaxID=3410089 RepID=UPI003CFAF025